MGEAGVWEGASGCGGEYWEWQNRDSVVVQVGVVIERKRMPGEIDHLRWYADALPPFSFATAGAGTVTLAAPSCTRRVSSARTWVVN